MRRFCFYHPWKQITAQFVGSSVVDGFGAITLGTCYERSMGRMPPCYAWPILILAIVRCGSDVAAASVVTSVAVFRERAVGAVIECVFAPACGVSDFNDDDRFSVADLLV